MTNWEIVTMSGYRISHPYLARDPQCPKQRHPTRNCGCEVFKTVAEANKYIEAKEAEAIWLAAHPEN